MPCNTTCFPAYAWVLLNYVEIMSQTGRQILWLATSLELKPNSAVCNDASWFAFDCEIPYEVIYPLFVVPGFRTCHNPHSLAPGSTLTRL